MAVLISRVGLLWVRIMGMPFDGFFINEILQTVRQLFREPIKSRFIPTNCLLLGLFL